MGVTRFLESRLVLALPRGFRKSVSGTTGTDVDIGDQVSIGKRPRSISRASGCVRVQPLVWENEKKGPPLNSCGARELCTRRQLFVRVSQPVETPAISSEPCPFVQLIDRVVCSHFFRENSKPWPSKSMQLRQPTTSFVERVKATDLDVAVLHGSDGPMKRRQVIVGGRQALFAGHEHALRTNTRTKKKKYINYSEFSAQQRCTV